MSDDMKTNQKVEGGFDLNAFVGKAETTPTPQKIKKPNSAPAMRAVKPVEKKRGGGRPPIPKEENLSDRAQVRMTANEMSEVKKKAGLVPVSAFLRAEMKKAGIL